MHHNQKICSFDKISFMKKTSIIFFYLLILVVQVKSHVQYTEVINSNRPGFSQSAFSVGKQVVQFEIGSYIINEKRTPYPNYEVEGFGIDFGARYGFLKESLEISINGNYQNDSQTYNITIPVENSRANFKHLRLGAKYLIYDPNKNKEDVIAETQYEIFFPSVIKKENIVGTQFHPEKSQNHGIQFFYNFLNYFDLL